MGRQSKTASTEPWSLMRFLRELARQALTLRKPLQPVIRQRAMEPQTRTQGKPGNERRDLTSATLTRMDGEGNERKFTLSFSSEEPYERWWGLEILDHSPGAVDLSRLNDIGCVLFNHNRDVVIGKINRAWIENNRGYAEIEFDTDEQSEVIYQKVRSGTLKGVSVGYRIDTLEEVQPGKTSTDGRFTGPAEIARKWWPFEISIVSVPADGTVGVGREAETTGASVPLEVFEAQLQINKNLNGGNQA